MSLSNELMDKLTKQFSKGDVENIKAEFKKISDLERQESALIQSIENLRAQNKEESTRKCIELNEKIADVEKKERDLKFQYQKSFNKLTEDQKLVEARLADMSTLEQLRDDLLAQKKKQDERELYLIAKQAELTKSTYLVDEKRKELETALSDCSARKNEFQALLESNKSLEQNLYEKKDSLTKQQKEIETRMQASVIAQESISAMLDAKKEHEDRLSKIKQGEENLYSKEIKLRAEADQQAAFREKLNNREKALEKLMTELESQKRFLDQRDLEAKVAEKEPKRG